MYRSKNIKESPPEIYPSQVERKWNLNHGGKDSYSLLHLFDSKERREREKKYGRKRKKDNLDANGGTTLLESN